EGTRHSGHRRESLSRPRSEAGDRGRRLGSRAPARPREARARCAKRTAMVESRLSKPLAIAAIAVALVLGVLLGIASGVVDRIFGGPDAKTIATSSLESMRAQNRLITF